MKQILYSLLGFWVIILASCERTDNLVSFNLDTKDISKWTVLEVNNDVLTDTFPYNQGMTLFSDEFLFSNNKKFEINKTSPANVKSLEGLNFVLEVDSVSGLGPKDFEFMRDLRLYVNETQIAEVENAELIGSQIIIPLRPTEKQFLTIMQKDRYRFRADFELYAPMPDSVYINYRLGYRVKASPN
jgi:hypothetical protein